jgi:hypothetical protein
MVRAFQVTVPDGAFAANSGNFVLALLKLKTSYMFSQRRVDIQDLLTNMRLAIREEERQRQIEIARRLEDLEVTLPMSKTIQ